MSVTIRIDMQLPVVLEMHIDLVQGPLCMCIPSIILYGGERVCYCGSACNFDS